MSYSISTLLTRNLHEVFGGNDAARRRAAIDEIFSLKIACSTIPWEACTEAARRSIESRAQSGLVYGVRGEWTYTPDGSGTVIRWTYEFKPLRRRYSLVRHMLAPYGATICRPVLKQLRAWPRTRICAVDRPLLDAALITH